MKLRHVVFAILLINAGGLDAMDKAAMSTDSLGRTELHKAAFAGDMYVLLQAIINSWVYADSKTIINQRDKQGRTPLHYAVKSGSLECVRTLLQNDANPNVRDAACAVHKTKASLGYTPLDFAAMRGDEEIVNELINNNDITSVTLKGAFACAIHARDSTPVSAKNKGHASNQLRAAIDACSFAILNSKKLFPEKAQEYECCQRVYKGELSLDSAVQYAQNYPLHQAVKDNDYEQCWQLIAAGESIDVCDDHDNSPLEYATQNNNYDIVKLLLGFESQSKINCALWLASYAFPSSTLPVENVPLLLASKKKIVDLLIAHGADINSYINESNQYTLLHKAIDDNQPQAVSVLLAYGARTDVCDAQGRTPRDLAIELGNKDIALLLSQKSKSSHNRKRFSSF